LKLKNKTVLLIITGSIAAYKVPELIQALREEGARVVPVLTEAAKKFVTPLTVRAVSGEAAVAMAEAARERLGADVGVGIAGALGPQTVEGRPAGLVFTAIADGRDRTVRQANYPQNLQDLKWRATNAALFDLLTWVQRR